MSFVVDIDNQIADLIDRRHTREQLGLHFITDIANTIIEFNDLCYEDVKEIRNIVTTDVVKEFLQRNLNARQAKTNADQCYYKLWYYEGDKYCGVDINNICRASSDDEAVLKIDQYVQRNSIRRIRKSIIGNTLDVILDWILDDCVFDDKVVTLQYIAMALVEELLTSNDTLYIKKMKVF